MATTGVRPTADGYFRARYRDSEGREHAKRFKRQTDAQAWLKAEQAKIRPGAGLIPVRLG